MLAKKKVKRQCGSKRFIQSKATGTTGARKREGKNASRLTMLHLNGYVKVSCATLAQI
jgi:hypothetical protein